MQVDFSSWFNSGCYGGVACCALAIAASVLYTTVSKRGTTRQLAGVVVTCVLSMLLLLSALFWYHLRFDTQQAALSASEVGAALIYVAMCGWLVPFIATCAYGLFALPRTLTNSVYLPSSRKRKGTTRGNAASVGVTPPRYVPGADVPFVFGEDVPWGWLEHRSGRFSGQRLELQRMIITLGREEDNDIWLDDDTASRYHAELAWSGGKVCLTDRDSLNGVLLNGRRIRGTVLVEQGDLIEIGSHRFLFEKAEPPKASGEDSLVRQAIWRNAWRDSIEQGDSEEKQQESSLVSGNAFSGALTMDWPSSSGGQPLRSPLHMTRPLGEESASSPEHVLQSGANSESGEYVPDGFISHGVDAWEETVILDYDAVMPQVLAPPSVFVIRSGVMEGQSFLLDRPLLTIGRGSESDVVVRDSSISRRHAQFIRQADGDYVLDLASRNGTKVNNEPLRAPRLLQHGDVISMGNVRLEYTSMLEASATPLPPLSLPSLLRLGSGPVPLRLPSKPKSE